MKMYEAAPGMWLCEGVTIAQHEAAMAGNYTGEDFSEFYGHATARKAPPMQPGIWRTKDGRDIPVADMTDDHLCNTIRMLERKEEAIRLRAFLASPYAGPGPRGDAAQDAFMAEAGDMADADFADAYPPYGWLTEEAERRGLK